MVGRFPALSRGSITELLPNSTNYDHARRLTPSCQDFGFLRKVQKSDFLYEIFPFLNMGFIVSACLI